MIIILIIKFSLRDDQILAQNFSFSIYLDEFVIVKGIYFNTYFVNVSKKNVHIHFPSIIQLSYTYTNIMIICVVFCWFLVVVN